MTPYSKDGRRTLSRFHAAEMIYEFCSGYLDPIRERNMRNSLENDPTLMSEVQRIRQALEYCGTLSQCPVSIKEVEAIKGDPSVNALDLIIEKTRIQHWPSGLRLGLESLVVVSAIFLVALLVPWNSLMDTIQSDRGLFTLSEVRRDYRVDGEHSGEMVAGEKPSEYDDEGFPIAELDRMEKPVESMAIVPQMTAPGAPAPIRPEIAEKGIADKGKISANPNPTPVPREVASAPKEKPAAVVADKYDESEDETETVKAADAAPAHPKATQGFLYRGRLHVTNVEATTPKLVAFVTGLGGRKAGKVPLGYQKENGSYFHFTIPSAKYEELENFFSEYGELKINKETHVRVMPEGIIRLIIEVDEKESKGPKETPKEIPPAAEHEQTE